MTETNLVSTSEIASKKIKFLIYGDPKVGKTKLITTIPLEDDSELLYVPIDPGYLILRDRNFPAYKPKNNAWSLEEAEKFYTWLLKQAALGKYKWVVIDGLDDMANEVLASFKKKNSNLLKAYGEMAEWCDSWIKRVRDIDGVNVIFITHLIDRDSNDEEVTYIPSIPGKKMKYEIDKYFDIVMCMRFIRTETGTKRILQTSSEADVRYMTGDRSGSLLPIEEPDLGAILNKIETSIPGSTRAEIDEKNSLLVQVTAKARETKEAKEYIIGYCKIKGWPNPTFLSKEDLTELLEKLEN